MANKEMKKRVFNLFIVILITTGTNSLIAQSEFKQTGNTSDNLSINLLSTDPSFNGDLGLSIPIITIPGRGGLDYELNLNYSSSVSVAQKSGWVGLGWNLHVGEIARGVVGRVDEQKFSMFCSTNPSCPEPFQLIYDSYGTSIETSGIMWGGYVEEEWDSYYLTLPEGSMELVPQFISSDDVFADEVIFRPASYKPYDIDMLTTSGVNLPSSTGLISGFKMTNSEGFIYHFDFVNNITIEDEVVVNDTKVFFKYPTSWKLTKIQSPYSDDEILFTYDKYAHSSQGSDKPIEYSQHSKSHSLSLGDGIMYGVGVDNSGEWIGNTYIRPTGVWSHLLYDYSYVSTIETPTHTAEFITELRNDNIGDSFRNGTASKQKKLVEIIVKEKQSDKIVKRVSFDYTGTQQSVVYYGEQLTLHKVSVTNPDDTDDKPINYGFTYNPTGSFNDGSIGISAGEHELTRLDLPEGGYLEYNYENDRYNWYFASWGNNSYNTGDFVYDDTPITGGGTRLTSVVHHDGNGNSYTYDYTYGDGVLHYTSDDARVSDLFSHNPLGSSGVNVGYRYVTVDLPSTGGFIKSHYTSAVNSTYKLGGTSHPVDAVDARESYPDDVDNLIRWVSSGYKQGVVWKREFFKDNSGTIGALVKKEDNYFSFVEEYRSNSPTHTYMPSNVKTISWKKDESRSVTVDGVTYKEEYSDYLLYSNSQFGNFNFPVNNKPRKVTRINSNLEESISSYRYASEEYSLMVGYLGYNMVDQLYSTTLLDANDTILSKSWSEWEEVSLLNLRKGHRKTKEWSWFSGNPLDPPSISNAISNLEYTYDQYANPIQITDGNDHITKYFYGSNSSPFSQLGMNGISGAYLTGVQKVNGTDNCSNCGTRPGSGDDLFMEAEYDNSGRLTKVIDENEKTINYGYDTFSRLSSTTNHLGGISKNNYFYTTAFDGTYSNLAPNYIETISGTDSFDSDFSTSSPFIKSGNYTFNYDYNGEITLRLGKTSSGGWSYIYRYPVEENLAVKIDFNPSSNYTSSVHPYAIALNDGSSGTPNRCSIRYNPSTDKLYVYRRKNNDNWDTGTTFTLNAPADKWYTLEIEKNNGVCMYWVYERGKSRSSGEYYQETGFPESWKPQVRSWSQDDYIYLSNLEFTVDPQSSIIYKDGLGREIQTQIKGSNNTIVTGLQYNNKGLPEATSRPITMSNRNTYVDYLFTGTSGSFNPESSSGLSGLGSPIEQYYTGLGMGSDADFAYSYVKYESNPLQRSVLSTLPGSGHKFGSGNELSTTFGLNSTETFTTSAQGSVPSKTWSVSSLKKTIIEDPDGKKMITYTDGWGQTIASGEDMDGNGRLDGQNKSTCSVNCDLITEFVYDPRGNLVRVEDPRGLATTYTYNTLGQLVEKKFPDQTLSHQYRYDKKGRLRFHMDPNQNAASDHYYYTKYDDLDRPTEIGKRNTSNDFNDQNDINNQSFPTSSYTAYIKYWYDGDNPLSGHTPNNTQGRLTKAHYKDQNSSYWGSTYYSYNSLGLVEWVIQQPAQPTSSNNRKIEYSYDELGRMTRMYFNPLSSSSDDHYFWYYYDELGRMEKVTSFGSNSEGSALIEAEYTYYADGQVEQLRLGDGAQIIDYDYTIQGWLEDINDGALSGTDQFGMFLDYANNGNISHQQWSQKAFSTGTYNYFYDYDSANRLKEACYGSTNSCTSTGDYDVTYEYDKSGNIDYISRNGAGSDPDIEYYISFVNGTNKVNDVLVDGVSSATKNYSYDASGNVSQNEVQGITSNTYDWRNLPTSLSANGSTLTYIYDADGNRVKKRVGSTETWYVRGADGQTIAAYQGSTLLYINIVAGGQIIGQIEN